MNFVTRLMLRLTLNCAALFIIMKIVPGIQIDRFQTLLAATVVIALLNTFLKPLVMLLALPVNVLTLGLFTFVINGCMFYLAAVILDGFRVSGFVAAMYASLLYSLFTSVAGILIPGKE